MKETENFTFKKTPAFDFMPDKDYCVRKRKWKANFYDLLLYIFDSLDLDVKDDKLKNIEVVVPNYLISYFELFDADKHIKEDLSYTGYVPVFNITGTPSGDKVVYVKGSYESGNLITKTIKVID